ncbi:MAG: hypothetical protein OXH69_19725 [Acidobacteria bacterium]|nr:hypothetical protein [Acidobacteriota bacterium]
MGSVASVLRVLSDFGAAAGWLIAALVLLAYGRRILKENEAAHAANTEKVAAITQNVAAITERVQENRNRLDEFGGTLHSIARDVAVLRDRSDRAGARGARQPAGLRGSPASSRGRLQSSA